MNLKIATGLVAGVLLLGTYYLEHVLESNSALSAEKLEGPEARQWLWQNESESALASNRFGETQNAARFVQQLYRAGAVRVIVPQNSIRDNGTEKYADTLVVTLSSDPAKRERVWKLCAQEIEREGGNPSESTSGNHIVLWWD